MGRVDRTKHDFDILEHVLGGVKTSAAPPEPDVITYRGAAVNSPDAAEVEVTIHHQPHRSGRADR